MEVEGRVMWGCLDAVYKFEEQSGDWIKTTTKAPEATLGVCGGKLVAIGGMDSFEKHYVLIPICSSAALVWDPKGWNGMGKWSDLASFRDCSCRACAVGIDGGGLVVMGGAEVEYGEKQPSQCVNVFDGKNTFCIQEGPSLPKPCWGMSGVVHDGVIYVMGGTFMGTSVWSANISDLMKPVSFVCCCLYYYKGISYHLQLQTGLTRIGGASTLGN